MLRLSILVVLAALTSIPGLSQAEPYLAVREGLMCSACHVNQTGMGKRNLYGVEFTQTDLPVMPTKSSESGMVLDRSLSDFISVGGDVRVIHNTTFPEVNRTGFTQDVTNTFQLFEANIYAEIVIKQDRFKIYVDEQVAPGAATSRELVGIFEGLPHGGWVKVGRMNLPYGYRLWDFPYTRSQTGLLGQDFGIELGLEPKNISFQAAVSNGEPFATTDSNDGKQFTMRVAAVGSRGRIGASFAANSEDPLAVASATGSNRALIMAGPFIGFTGGPFTVLGEFDMIRAFDTTLGDFKVRYAAYGEVNILVSQGVNAKIAFDYFDRRLSGITAKRIRIGLEPTINEFMQLRAFYDINRPRVFADPIFGTGVKQDQLSLELHMMF